MNLTESEKKSQRKGESEGGGGEKRENEIRERQERQRWERKRETGWSIFKPIRVIASKKNDKLTDIQVWHFKKDL